MPDNPIIKPLLITGEAAENIASKLGFDIRVDPSMEKDDYIMIVRDAHETRDAWQLDSEAMEGLLKTLLKTLEKELSPMLFLQAPYEMPEFSFVSDTFDAARIYPPEFLREYCNKVWYLPELAPAPSPIVTYAMSPHEDNKKIYHWGVVLEGEEKIENTWLITHFLERVTKFLYRYNNDEICDMIVFIKNKKFYTDKMVKAFDDIEYDTERKEEVPSLVTLMKYIE